MDGMTNSGPTPEQQAAALGDPGASRWGPAEAALVYAPPMYPTHDYTGQGACWTLGFPGDPVAGILTTTPALGPVERVCFSTGVLGRDTMEGLIATLVFTRLREGARDGVPVQKAVREILDTTPLQAEYCGLVDLATLAGHDPLLPPTLP